MTLLKYEQTKTHVSGSVWVATTYVTLFGLRLYVSTKEILW